MHQSHKKRKELLYLEFALAVFLMLLALTFISALKQSGFAIAPQPAEYFYTLSLQGLPVNTLYDYLLYAKNNTAVNITSLAISGEILGEGDVSLYLENKEHERLLIFTNEPKRWTLREITGFAPKDKDGVAGGGDNQGQGGGGQGGGQGNAENAPGHSENGPGNSENAPGHNKQEVFNPRAIGIRGQRRLSEREFTIENNIFAPVKIVRGKSLITKGIEGPVFRQKLADDFLTLSNKQSRITEGTLGVAVYEIPEVEFKKRYEKYYQEIIQSRRTYRGIAEEEPKRKWEQVEKTIQEKVQTLAKRQGENIQQRAVKELAQQFYREGWKVETERSPLALVYIPNTAVKNTLSLLTGGAVTSEQKAEADVEIINSFRFRHECYQTCNIGELGEYFFLRVEQGRGTKVKLDEIQYTIKKK